MSLNTHDDGHVENLLSDFCCLSVHQEYNMFFCSTQRFVMISNIFFRVILFVLCVAMCCVLAPCSFGAGPALPERVTSFSLAAKPPEQVTLRYLATLPHDRSAFTQGLLWDGGYLYESTGQYGQSTVRRVEPKSGKVTASLTLPHRFFGEGLALVEDSLFLLTWREETCLIFDKATLQFKREFKYPGEGWGLTYDGESLIMSNGTNVIRFLDPKTFRRKREIKVVDTPRNQRSVPIHHLNELEWIRGEIWANVWQTTRIVRIDPAKGVVLGWFELAPFVPPEHRNDTQECVLNGIAYDPETQHVYITGKRWSVMYQFQLEMPEKKP